MIKFEETHDGYIFSKDNTHLAVGVYEQGSFHLFHDDKLMNFANAMMAFSYLGDVYEPHSPKQKTLEMLTKPADHVVNLTKYKDNVHLKDLTKEEFHAYLPN